MPSNKERLPACCGSGLRHAPLPAACLPMQVHAFWDGCEAVLRREVEVRVGRGTEVTIASA